MTEITLTNENFETEVLSSKLPVLVDFWASWCTPCMMLSPIIEEIAHEYEGSLKVGKVNVDEQNELAIRYRIASIPALLFFQDGKLSDTFVGFHSKEEILEKFNIH